MSFCKKERLLVDSGYTAVDNKFFINYLPDAPDIRSAVYLLGLALSESEGDDNSCETVAQKLGISCSDVMSAYQYWEELGLVRVLQDNPPSVVYLSVRSSASSLKKIKPSKYAKFTREIQNVIEGRMITVNEFNEYFMFLENTTFEPEALVAVAKYCVELKGKDINYPYILTVARNQIQKGATTLAAVSDNLNSQQKYDEDLKIVFKALHLNRKFEHNDRECYEKWTKEMGFTLPVILFVAKRCKSGGINKLDSLICDYYKSGALSEKEIEQFDSEKERLYDLARAINKSIGVYYQSLDMIVDEYLITWLRKGFDDETLLAVAKYCFRSGIRSLAGLASVIDKLYKNGVTTLTALEQYLAALAQNDAEIKEILNKAGLDRNVTANDRMLYKTWTQTWGISREAVAYTAENAAGTASPMAYMNRILSDCKQNGLFTLEQVKSRKNERASAAATTAKAYIGGRDMERRTYTDEQLNALFNALDDTED